MFAAVAMALRRSGDNLIQSVLEVYVGPLS